MFRNGRMGIFDYFVFVSHDSFLDIEVPTPEIRKKALSSFKKPRMDQGLAES
jgi:hypothetical protein